MNRRVGCRPFSLSLHNNCQFSIYIYIYVKYVKIILCFCFHIVYHRDNSNYIEKNYHYRPILRKTRSYMTSPGHHWRILFEKISLGCWTHGCRWIRVVALTMTTFNPFFNCFQPLSKSWPPLYTKELGWCCLSSLASCAHCPWHVPKSFERSSWCFLCCLGEWTIHYL